jgi:hypothetical protein
MEQARYLYSELAEAIGALHYCKSREDKKWIDKWTERIKELSKLLPSGSGIDSGCKIDLDKSHATKLVIHTAFHHINNAGYYDGWTEHTVTVVPSFQGIIMRISGRDRNEVKEYLYGVFDLALWHECPEVRL